MAKYLFIARVNFIIALLKYRLYPRRSRVIGNENKYNKYNKYIKYNHGHC